ncbi:hypothetical protein [Caulobacter sp. 17J65-9]|uniref:hypothetical protein n=1 Tax=Caulobacter sp. 17J65-9 TaxID=2709382 RepID=UPI0013C8F781|nr:hypothetical protein [Caulobacter sp. 17J65-9]NEX91182.1 hypothetical protein [Caulobacter sp. 17J65-9]
MRVHLQRPHFEAGATDEVWLLTVPGEDTSALVIAPPEARALMGQEVEGDFEAEHSEGGWFIGRRLPPAGSHVH